MKEPTVKGIPGPSTGYPMNEQFPPSQETKNYTLGMGNNLQPPLSGQQMQALAKQHADALAAIKRDVDLRKWAVDQAVGLAGAKAETDGPTFYDPVALARSIHAFLVENIREEQ